MPGISKKLPEKPESLRDQKKIARRNVFDASEWQPQTIAAIRTKDEAPIDINDTES